MLEEFQFALMEEDVCPKCLGDLDMCLRCVQCGYDTMELVEKVFNDCMAKEADLVRRVLAK